MEGKGLKFTPVVVNRLLCPLSMFGPMTGTSWTHSWASPNNPSGGFNLPLAAPSNLPTPLYIPLVILQLL